MVVLGHILFDLLDFLFREDVHLPVALISVSKFITSKLDVNEKIICQSHVEILIINITFTIVINFIIHRNAIEIHNIYVHKVIQIFTSQALRCDSSVLWNVLYLSIDTNHHDTLYSAIKNFPIYNILKQVDKMTNKFINQ